MEEPTKEEIRQAAEVLHKKYGRPVEFYIELMTEDAFAVHTSIVGKRLKARREKATLAHAA